MNKLILIKINKSPPNGFGFHVQDDDGKVIVTSVSEMGAAFASGLQKCDILHSFNGDIIESSDDLTSKIKNTRNDIMLEVLRTSGLVGRQQSASNVSKGSSHSSDGSRKLAQSMSSVDLSASNPNRRILDVNYVPHDCIDQYLQPLTPNDSLYKSDNELESSSRIFNLKDNSIESSQSQVIRKQAYPKKVIDVGQSEGPRFSVKKANKAPVIQVKDPAFTIKKKTNVGDGVLILSAVKGRYNTAPVIHSQQNIPTNITHSNSSNELSNLQNSNNNSNSSNLCLPQMSVPSNQCASLTSYNGLQEFSKTDVVLLEAELRIISFKEKIKRPSWKKFMIEKDALGVLFQRIDGDDGEIACNSTAIDPLISGLDVYMGLWQNNNTTSRFFLPINQQGFSHNIEIIKSVDNFEIKYNIHNVYFWINCSKMTDEKCATLYNLLGVKYEFTEITPQPKKTRPVANTDNFKNDNKKQKVQKYLSESPRISLIGILPQTSLIEKVPLVVIICVNIIEKLGINLEGIYRKPGNEGAKKKLENVILHEDIEKWSELEEWSNINTVCSLLKSILRGFSLIDRDTAIKLSMINLTSLDQSNQEQVYMDMIYHLRQRMSKADSRTDHKERYSQEMLCRRETFKYMLKHLNRVSQCRLYNQMSEENLATCFSPTIFEDIPCDENGEYQDSKKSDADKNLKQMLSFWIKYAVLLCELLEENDEEQLLSKVLIFADNKYNSAIEETEEEVNEGDADVRNIIEQYTKTAFIPISESDSLLSITTTEVNNFTRLKNLGGYRSYKQPKTENLSRRSSSNFSPSEVRRKVPIFEGTLDPLVKGINPILQKRPDNWTSKSFRVKKKDVFLTKKKLSLVTLFQSGIKKDVPLVVDIGITIIENYGLDLDGIYRVSGKKQDINTVEELVVNNRIHDWYKEPYVSMWSNLYVTSCLLKAILKQICLIKKETWVHMSSQFSERMGEDDVRKVLLASAYHLRHMNNKASVDASSTDYIETRINECENDIRSATLRYVLRHLNTVSRHVNNNRMTSTSLAVCFLPVLVEEEESPTVNIMTNNNKGIQILEKLIEHCDWIFQWDGRPWEDIYGKVMTDSLDSYLASYSKSYTIMSSNIPDSAANSDEIKELLERFIGYRKCPILTKFTVRRHSDGSNSSRKSDYVDHGDPDDNRLQDVTMPNNMSITCSRSLQNTDSL